MSAQRGPAVPRPPAAAPKPLRSCHFQWGPWSRSYCHPQATPKEKSRGQRNLVLGSRTAVVSRARELQPGRPPSPR